MDKPRVLIVEDHASTRAALLALFARRGWVVVMTGTVAGGLAHLDPPPRCVVLDLMLPDGDGEAVLREVRARNLETRVAICTGTHDPDRLAALEPLRPDAVLRKPINVADLFAVCAPTAAR